MKQELMFSSRIHCKKGFVDKTEFGPNFKDNPNIISNLKSQFNHLLEKSSAVNWIKVNGSTFKSGLVVRTNINSTEKKFVEIVYCIENNGSPLFYVYDLVIEDFLSHYQSFKILESDTKNYSIIDSNDINSRPASKNKHKDGILIRVRDL